MVQIAIHPPSLEIPPRRNRFTRDDQAHWDLPPPWARWLSGV